MEQFLRSYITQYVIEGKLREIIEYALFPCGKLFRPNLVMATCSDLGIDNKENQQILCAAIEFHHNYTLIHDDLPAMDDDDMRRGRESVHKRYGEANAILAGDALLALSFQILAALETDKLSDILNLFGSKTGANGLILGQYEDLAEKELDISKILRIHELKTSNLIELCLTLPSILTNNDSLELLEKLGQRLGIIFQLTDDLLELNDEISSHEKEINPFLTLPIEVVLPELNSRLVELKSTLGNDKFKSLSALIMPFLDKRITSIRNTSEAILKNHNLKIEIDW